MDSVSNLSFYQGRIINCTNCGFPLQIDAMPALSIGSQEYSIQYYNLLEESIKPTSNLGDHDVPESSSEEEPAEQTPVKSSKAENPFKSFKTNLSNNRWLKGKTKQSANQVRQPQRTLSASYTGRKPLVRVARPKPIEDPPTKVVKIDLYRSRSKAVSSPINTINLVERVKKPRNEDDSNSIEKMPPIPKPIKPS